MKFKIILTLFFLIINISSALAEKWIKFNGSKRPSEGIEATYYSKKGLVKGLFATSVELLSIKEPKVRSEGTFNST